MYNAEKIIISLFSAPARRITGQGDDTTYSVMSSLVVHELLGEGAVLNALELVLHALLGLFSDDGGGKSAFCRVS